MESTFYPHWPQFQASDISAVGKVLESGKINYWTGEECRLFEKEYAKYVGTTYAIALMNGTVSLEGALYALNIGQNDEVITTSRTFIASASAIVLRGATPVFADIDENSQNITAETIARVLTTKTKAIIVVHLAGWPCDMDPILELANKYNLYVIEDCAQAHGAKYKGKQVGSMGTIGSFSFCQDKIISTGGEGGMITTNNRQIWEKIWSFKDHGKSYDAVYHREHPIGFRFVHESFGTNWRMTEIQAVLGRAQLKILPESLAIRKRNANILTQILSDLPLLKLPIPPKEIEHAFYKYYVFIRPEYLKSTYNRDKILQEILNLGVPAFTGSCSEIYQEKAFTQSNFKQENSLPVAKMLGDTSLMFLVHPTLSENHMCDMGNKIKNIAQKATR